MNKITICNAWSHNMLDVTKMTKNTKLLTVLMTPAEVKESIRDGFNSAMGHSTELASKLIGMDIPMNRCSNKIQDGESVIVCQYSGPRLAEGCTELPPGAEMLFIMTTVIYG